MYVPDPNSIPKLADQADTPEDVASLYSWANLHGAKYRDFSASRAEAREDARRRAEEARAAEQRRIAEEAERKAQEEAQIAARVAAEAAEAARQAEAERMAEIARQAEAERQAVLAAQEAQRLAALQRSWEPRSADMYTDSRMPNFDDNLFEPLPFNSITPNILYSADSELPSPNPPSLPNRRGPTTQGDMESSERPQRTQSPPNSILPGSIGDPFAPPSAAPSDSNAQDLAGLGFSAQHSRESTYLSDLDAPYTPSFLTASSDIDSYTSYASDSSRPAFRSPEAPPSSQRQTVSSHQDPAARRSFGQPQLAPERTSDFSSVNEPNGNWPPVSEAPAQTPAQFAMGQAPRDPRSQSQPSHPHHAVGQTYGDLARREQFDTAASPHVAGSDSQQFSQNVSESAGSPFAASYRWPQTPDSTTPWQNVAPVVPPRQPAQPDRFGQIDQLNQTNFQPIENRDAFARPAWLSPELPTPPAQPLAAANPPSNSRFHPSAKSVSQFDFGPQPRAELPKATSQNPASQYPAQPNPLPHVYPANPPASRLYSDHASSSHPSPGLSYAHPNSYANSQADTRPVVATTPQPPSTASVNPASPFNPSQTQDQVQKSISNGVLNPHQSPSQNPAQQVPSEDQSLLDSRDRIAHRWYALRNLFDPQAVQEQPPVQAHARVPALAVFSLAGGVGKTSLVAALARSLASRGESVLLVDTAIYGLLPFYFGATDQRPGQLRTFNPPMVTAESPVQLITLDPEGQGPNGDSVLSTAGLSAASLDKSQFSSLDYSQDWLTHEVVRLSRGSSRILIDLPTASGATTRRMLKLAPVVIVPVIPDMNSVVSVSAIESFFRNNIGLHTRGSQASVNGATMPYYLMNQFDYSLPLHLDVREVLRDQLGDRLLPFALRRSPAVSEALAEGMTVIDYAPTATIAEDYAALAGWARNLTAPANVAHRGVRWSER